MRRLREQSSWWLTVLFVTLTPALGQAESAADKAAADALFDEARKSMKAKDYDAACPKFAESFRLSERLGTLLNLATCHEEQGKTASAWAEFNEAAALARREKRADREKYAKKHADQLEKNLARVSFVMPKNLDRATLELDAKEIGESVWGTALPVDPGKHSVTVVAKGFEKWTGTVDARPGETIKLEVPALVAASEAPDEKPGPMPVVSSPDRKKPEPEPDKTSGGGSSTFGWIVLGVGVVGVGAGSYFGLQTFSKKSKADDHCGKSVGQSESTLCDQEGVDLRKDAKSAATLSTIAFAVGAVGIGAGLYLVLSSGSNSERAAKSGVWLSPNAGPNGGGLTLGGRL